MNQQLSKYTAVTLVHLPTVFLTTRAHGDIFYQSFPLPFLV